MFIIICIFLFFIDLFFKFFKCRLFIKHSRRSTENGFEHWESWDIKKKQKLNKISIIFDFYFYFFQPVSGKLISLLQNFVFHFLLLSLNNLTKNRFSKLSLKKGKSMMILKIAFVLLLHTSAPLTRLEWTIKKISKILRSQFNYQTLPVTPLSQIVR